MRDVTLFLKHLAAVTGFLVVPISDGDIRPQSKRDAFKQRFKPTMNYTNSNVCRQFAMKLASKGEKITEEKEKKDLFNNKTRALEDTTHVQVP